MPNTKMDDESGSIQSDEYYITEVQTVETDTAQVVRPDGAGRLRVVEASPILQFPADRFQNPADTPDWAVDTEAVLDNDTEDPSLLIRYFDDGAEWGVGMTFAIPLDVTNLIVALRSRAEVADPTNLGVVPRLYVREAPDNAAVEAWSAGTDMTAITMGISNLYFQYDVQSIPLTTLGLVAGRVVQMELTRNTAAAGDTLVDNWVLLMAILSFS